jgi:hypothetical protein
MSKFILYDLLTFVAFNLFCLTIRSKSFATKIFGCFCNFQGFLKGFDAFASRLDTFAWHFDVSASGLDAFAWGFYTSASPPDAFASASAPSALRLDGFRNGVSPVRIATGRVRKGNLTVQQWRFCASHRDIGRPQKWARF